MKKQKIALLLLLLALVVLFFVFDLGRFFSLDYIKARTRRLRRALRSPALAGGGRVLRGLRGGDGAVLAGCGDHDAAGRRHLRPVGRHGAGVLCIEPGCPACDAGLALCPARHRQGEVRRAAGRHRPRHRARRRVLPVHAAPGAGVSVLHHQPADGPDDDQGRHLLLGQPARHAGGHAGVRERGHAAGADQLAAGHPVARVDRLVRAARCVSADREEDRRCGPGAQGVCEVGASTSRRSSIATWSSSAPARRGW